MSEHSNEALDRTRQFGDAVSACLAALRSDPASCELMVRLAYLYECEGMLEEAERWYERSVKMCPARGDIHARLGNLALDTNEFDDARSHLERAVALDPDRGEVHWGLARIAFHDADLAAALGHAEKSVQVAPGTAKYWAFLGYFREMSEASAEAEQAYRKAVSLESRWYEIWSKLGWFSVNRDDWHRAIADFSTAAEGDPTLAEGHWGMAEALNMLGRHDDARASIERGLDLDPSNPDYYECLGRILTAMDIPEEAEKALRTALLLQPDWGRAECNLGHALAKQARMEEAGIHFQRAVDFEPDESGYWSALGEYLEEAGDYPQAEKAFRKAIELESSYERYHWLLARLLLFLGRSDEAATSLLSVEVEPAPRELRALVAAANGDMEEARVHAEEAEKDASEEYEAVTLGPMWELLGDRKRALSHYEKGSEAGDRFASVLLAHLQ